jgi:formamidopyrimidine-DNA glycosylase
MLNKIIEKVVVYRDKIFSGEPASLVGAKVSKVGRRAKMVVVEFESRDEVVQVHLKMTGQLIYTEKIQNFEKSKTQNKETRIVGGHPSADWVADLPSKHTRVEIVFEDGSKLFFNDMRAFGWMRIVEKTQKLEADKNQIPDVVDEGFSLGYFTGVLSKIKRPIKVVLLDQQLMGGIGNIYANDALNLAKVLPSRSASSLSKSEAKGLHEAITFVIDLGIKTGGASAANYVDTKGLGGNYQNFFLTYKREGQPCKNCGSKIVKIKLGGRGTFYCPDCQR